MEPLLQRRVRVERVYEYPLDAVWPFLRRYAALADWHPWAAACHMEQEAPEDRIGAVRIVTGHPKPNIARERLLALDEAAHVIEYNVESGLPLEDYLGRAQLWPLTPGRTRLLWVVSFRALERRADRWAGYVERILSDGVEAIQQRLALGKGPVGP